jgi:hypothetical protein
VLFLLLPLLLRVLPLLLLFLLLLLLVVVVMMMGKKILSTYPSWSLLGLHQILLTTLNP